jgi:tetratricopeptide (TPR) repeat protein
VLTRLRAAGRATGRRLSAAKTSVPKPKIPAVRRRPRRDPRVERALVFNSEGIALAKEGKHAEAIDAFDTALALLSETGDRHHEGQVLANLGFVHRSVGGTEAARFCWVRALERLEPGTRESELTAELLGVR